MTDAVTIYVCPCGYRSLTPGKCRSHPFPARAMGPEMTPVEFVVKSQLDPTQGSALREAMVLGFAEGARWAGWTFSGPSPQDDGYPADSEVVEKVMVWAESFDDLYPILSALAKESKGA